VGLLKLYSLQLRLLQVLFHIMGKSYYSVPQVKTVFQWQDQCVWQN